nr:MAG TPA: hypothetical protein [Caudoviricetes sp.]
MYQFYFLKISCNDQKFRNSRKEKNLIIAPCILSVGYWQSLRGRISAVYRLNCY